MKFGRKLTRTKWIFKIKKSVTTRHTIVDSWVHVNHHQQAPVILGILTLTEDGTTFKDVENVTTTVAGSEMVGVVATQLSRCVMAPVRGGLAVKQEVVQHTPIRTPMAVGVVTANVQPKVRLLLHGVIKKVMATVVQVAVTAAPTLAAVIVAVPRESPRDAPIAIQTEIVEAAPLDSTSPALLVSNALEERRVSRDHLPPHRASPTLTTMMATSSKRKVTEECVTTRVNAAPMIVVDHTAVVRKGAPKDVLIVMVTGTAASAVLVSTFLVSTVKFVQQEREASPVLLLPPIASNLLLIRKKLKQIDTSVRTNVGRVALENGTTSPVLHARIVFWEQVLWTMALLQISTHLQTTASHV